MFVSVFQSHSLFSDGEPPPVTAIDTGHPVTYISTSCDGLTLLVIILQDEKPKALFYDIRSIVPGVSTSCFAVTSFMNLDNVI